MRNLLCTSMYVSVSALSGVQFSCAYRPEKGRTWAIAVRRGSYNSLFLLNSGRFSLEKVPNFGSRKTVLIAMAQVLSLLIIGQNSTLNFCCTNILANPLGCGRLRQESREDLYESVCFFWRANCREKLGDPWAFGSEVSDVCGKSGPNRILAKCMSVLPYVLVFKPTE